MSESRKRRLKKLRHAQEMVESGLLTLRNNYGDRELASAGFKSFYYVLSLAKRAKVKEGK
jgi:hypothetical protein